MATTNLHLLRHADAGDPARWAGPDDSRPLSEAGIGQAERLAAHLAALGIACDAVLTSPRVRAADTAWPVAKALGLEPRVDERLAQALTIERLEALLVAAGNPRNPILVGHDPDFSDLLSELIGAAGMPMKKGALARLETRRPLAAGAARLRWLLPPDALAGR